MSNYKSTLTTEASDALLQMVKRVNEGFLEGKVSRADLLSWIVVNFSEKNFERAVPLIRKEHFDPVRALQLLAEEATKAKRDGVRVPNLEKIQNLFQEVK